jgi:hypothetical protein
MPLFRGKSSCLRGETGKKETALEYDGEKVDKGASGGEKGAVS